MITVYIRYGSVYGGAIADLTPFASTCKWSRNLHGALSLEMQAPRSYIESARIYSATGLVFVVVYDGVRLMWSGRLAAPELWSNSEGSGITIRAYGLWETLDDVPYTALWSSTKVAEWREITAQDLASRTPERYVIDTNNRLFIGLKKDAQYTSSTRGALGFVAPDGGSRSILVFTADVEHNLPSATWDIRLQRFDTGFSGSATTVTTITGTGSVATTTINQTWAATCAAIVVEVVYNSGVATTYTGEDGASYVRLTNIRIKTTTATNVTAFYVAAHLAPLISSVNSFIASEAISADPGYDLTDLAFEDTKPTQVLNYVAGKGDGAGTIYVAGVSNEGQIYLQTVGANGRTWYVDITDMRAASDRTKLANSVYATYKDANGRTLRTGITTDSASVSRYGYTRRTRVDVDTTNNTRAEEWRNTYIADSATAPGQADISFDRVYTPGGGLGQLTDVLPGDAIVIRNLPLIYATGSDIDRVRSFRITETEYDAINNVLSVTPETPLPRLDVLVAQNAI